MEELKRTKRITIATWLFLIVLAIAFLTFKKPLFQYKLSTEDLAADLLVTYQVTPDEAMELMYDSSTVFVDIRSIYDYELNHFENAYNIPVAQLLTKENKALYDKWQADSVRVILYGRDEAHANTPWMLLYQLGYTNMRTLMGGMNYVNKLYNEELAKNESYDNEKPAYDFAGIISAAGSGKTSGAINQPKKKVVIRKKKKKAAEGGC